MDPRKKMEEHKRRKITNEEVTMEFNNMPPVENFICRQTLRFLGKLVRINDKQKQKKATCMDTNITKKGSTEKN